MTEQDLGRDPKTGKRIKRPPSGDAAQNLNYIPATHPAETAMDHSRPHTIPPEQWEEDHGTDHDSAVADWKVQEAKRKADEAALDAADE